MAQPQDSKMAETPTDVDVIINRVNLSLARSQKLINSWLPPKPAEDSDQNGLQTLDSDEDFKPMTERGGIGSTIAYDDEGLRDGAFQRNKLSSNDKLLEQLLGKKAAGAKRKERDVGKSMTASRHAAPKPLATRPKREVESEDEEEGGRAAAFKSRRSEKSRKEVGQKAEQDADDAGNEKADMAALSDAESDERSAKKGTGSYLDELLAKKAKKKKKNNKKKHKPSQV